MSQRVVRIFITMVGPFFHHDANMLEMNRIISIPSQNYCILLMMVREYAIE